MHAEKHTVGECLTLDEMFAYLGHRMTPEQETLADRHLEHCALCCGALEALENSPEAQHSQQGQLQEMEQVFRTEAAKLGETHQGGHRRFQWLKYAAVLLLLLLPGYFIYDRLNIIDHDTLFTYYFTPYEDVLTVRAGELTPGVITEGMAYYNDRDYHAAAMRFEEVLRADSDHRLVRLYAGISYLQLDSTTKAADHFGRMASEPGMLQEQALWYLALTYLKAGNIPQCVRVLNELGKQNGPYRARARELLNIIS